MDLLTIQGVFPLPIYRFQIVDEAFNDRHAALLSGLDFKAARNGVVAVTDGRLHARPEFADLKQKINSSLERIRTDYGYQCDRFEISMLWANKLATGVDHHRHHHPNAYFSGVYTPTAVASPITFTHPCLTNLMGSMMVPIKPERNAELFEVVASLPQPKGSLLVFPWFLTHQVGTNYDDSPRHSFSFNAVPRGTLGSDSTLTSLAL